MTNNVSLAGDPYLAEIEAFLDECEAEKMHPDDVARRLRRQGWNSPSADLLSDRYRRRYDEHALGYSAFLFAVGFSALAFGSSMHILLDALDRARLNRDLLAQWMTILVVAVPLAVWAWSWVERVDRSDPVAAWSGPRRVLAKTLLWACGVVGGMRLLNYVFTLIATITGSAWAEDRNLLVGLANVAVTVSITFPLGVWAFRFLHRFDGRRSA